MDDDIKITAEFDKDSSDVCKFIVDRPVHAGRIDIHDREQAKGIPLAEKLFQIEDVAAVSFYGPVVVITLGAGKDWKDIGRQVGTAIREYIQAGMAPTEEQMRASLPDQNLIRDRVLGLLEMQINPGVAGHGGFVELIDVRDNNVYIRMSGGCQGCGMADVTLKQGIERLIRDEVPEVWEVFDSTDHASGKNPYYEPAK